MSETRNREWGIHGERLPEPDDIVHYPDGSFAPMMFHFATDESRPAVVARENGFELCFVEMLDELGEEHELSVAYLEGSGDVHALWTPGPEIVERLARDGWRLAGKTDSPDGPVAIFLRRMAEQPAPTASLEHATGAAP